MSSTRRQWLRGVPFWTWLATMLVFGLASACQEVTVPPVVEPEDTTTTEDSTPNNG